MVNLQVSYCFVAKNIFISSSFLKDCFAGDTILGWQLFFSYLKNMSPVSPGTSGCCWEISCQSHGHFSFSDWCWGRLFISVFCIFSTMCPGRICFCFAWLGFIGLLESVDGLSSKKKFSDKPSYCYWPLSLTETGHVALYFPHLCLFHLFQHFPLCWPS